MKGILALATLFALAWLGCSDAAPTCKIRDNGDGTRTIACPGAAPIRVVDGDANAVCTIATDEAGGKVISCSDGTFVQIGPDGNVIFPGSGRVAGHARRFGAGDHAGIVVRAEGTDHATTTDEMGRYELQLPAGIHVLLFESPPRKPVRVENVPVINGVWFLPPVELRYATRLAPAGEVDVAPDGDAVLVRVTTGAFGGWLSLWELDSDTEIPLGGIVSGASFSEDGSSVLYQQRSGSVGPLELYHRPSGLTVPVAELSERGAFLRGGTHVLYETREDGCTLYAWEIASRTAHEIGTCMQTTFMHEWLGWPSGHDGRFLYRAAGGQLVVHDLGTGRGWSVSASQAHVALARFLPDGYHVLFTRTGLMPWEANQYILDARTGEEWLLAVNGDQIERISADGSTILATQRPEGNADADLIAFRLHERRRLTLGSGAIHAADLSADGRWVVWREAGTVRALDLEQPENPRTFEHRGLLAQISADGTYVVVVGEDNRLWSWQPATGVTTHLADGVHGFTWSPDKTQVAAATPGGTMLVVELASSTVHEALLPNVAMATWFPSGGGLAVGHLDETGIQRLVRWHPPAEPEAVGGGQLHSFTPTPGGNLVFLDCPGVCPAGPQLVVHEGESDARSAYDAPVSFFLHENGVLVYGVNDRDDGDRSGLWATQLP